MKEKNNATRSHRKSRITFRGKSVPFGTSPACWLWAVPEAPERILFIDETRDKKFAVYYVDDLWQTDTGQKKQRFTQLAPQPLRGAMQITLNEFAKERGWKPCRKTTWLSVQNSLKTGGEL